MSKETKSGAEKWLRAINTKHLMCRGLRHQWEPDGKFKGVVGADRRHIRVAVGFSQIVQLQLLCRRCEAVRIDLFGRTSLGASNGSRFVKLRTKYLYPKDYKYVTKKFGERPRSTDYYKEMYRRLR